MYFTNRLPGNFFLNGVWCFLLRVNNRTIFALLEQILFDMLLFTDFDNGTVKTLVNLTNFWEISSKPVIF